MEPFAHASIGLMAKPFAPKAPLWSLLAATAVPDALSLGFIRLGIERGAVTQLDFAHGLRYLSQQSIGWSHGLLMSLVWSAVVAAVALLMWRDRKTSVVLGLMVLGTGCWILSCISTCPSCSAPRHQAGSVSSRPAQALSVALFWRWG